jgi:hypothetical protein
MKRIIAIIFVILIFAFGVWAIPPSPPSTSSVTGLTIGTNSSLTVSANVTANITANLDSAAYNATSAFQGASANLTPLASNNGANITGVNADLLDGSHGAAFLGVNATALLASGLTGTPNITVADIVANSVNATFIGTVNAANVTGLTTDSSTASHYLYKNASGNITDVTIGAGLNDTAGTLTVRQLASFSFVDRDGAVTASMSKKGYTVPLAYNGSNVTTMTCSVSNITSVNADTIINLSKERSGNLTVVFDTGVNIANTDYTATSTGANTTGAALLTGDTLFGNVTSVGGNAPLGLTCTFTITK